MGGGVGGSSAGKNIFNRCQKAVTTFKLPHYTAVISVQPVQLKTTVYECFTWKTSSI